MGRFTRYFISIVAWLSLTWGILIITIAFRDYESVEANTVKDIVGRFAALFMVIGGAVLMFCARVLTLMEEKGS